MKFCPDCGSSIEQNQDVCLKCGNILLGKKVVVKDEGGFLYGLISFCIPIVGLILFLVWRDDKPKTSRTVGIAALVGFLLNLLSAIVLAFLSGI